MRGGGPPFRMPWVVGTWRAPCSLGDIIKAGPPSPPPCLIMAAWEATAACRDWLAICSLGAPGVSRPAEIAKFKLLSCSHHRKHYTHVKNFYWKNLCMFHL